MLELTAIHKSFNSVEVLSGINLQLDQGKILGLVGENGAGKSTLMNILGGVLQPTKGSMTVNGSPYEPQSTHDATRKGIAFIHQELNLFTNLSIQENLFIQDLPKQQSVGLFISKKQLTEKSKELLSKVGLALSPNTLVSDLTNAQRQLVEVAKALSNNPRLIILDEPTTALSSHESDQLFKLIDQLKAMDITMIYISHNLEDVLRLSDKIAVLRDGHLVAIEDTAKCSKQDLVKKMIGRSLEKYFPEKKQSKTGEVALAVKGISSEKFSNISFEMRKQEIVGFYGLVGAGRSELVRSIMGIDPYDEGRIIWQQKEIRKPSPRLWIRHGVVLLTEDRGEDGLLHDKGIIENVQLASLPDFANRFKWLDYSTIKKVVGQFVKSTRVKFNDLNQEVASLSGGNQQKVILAKWLMTKPKLLILDEPTKGIDIGAKQEIYELINELAGAGSSILFISSEIEELLGMCDRILVMNQGEINASFDRSVFDRSAMLQAALHKTKKIR